MRIHKSRSARAALVTLLGLSLVAGIAQYVPEAQAKTPSGPAPAVQKQKSTPGKDFVAPPAKKVSKTAPAESAKPVTPVWPEPTVSQVSTSGMWQPGVLAGTLSKSGSPVSAAVVAPTVVGAAKGMAAPTAKLEILGQDASNKLGIAGVAMRLSRTDTQAGPAKLKVSLDYSKFADAYGGDWSSRLRLVQLSCDSAGCGQEREVPTGSNNTAGKLVSGEVELPAAPNGKQTQFTTLAVAADASGSTGSYAATSLSPSSVWNVGAQTGDFSWSYPLRVPPGTAGPKPELSINYSSGSVDGQVASTNNQASWVGQGQTLEPGFVERKYVSCADDMANSNTTVKTGDLCWKSDNAVLSLGAHSGELIKISSDAVNKIDTFRLKNDDGSLVQRRYGATNGAQGGEYWQVTTTDGTKYYFGLNPQVPGDARADSVSTVPVFGNQTNEPCNKPTFAASYCTQAWRWNVDRVVDLSNNLMSYRYIQENNYYGRNNNTGVSLYQRASYPWIIDYGKVAGSTETTTGAPARVWFGVSERCIPTGTITCAPAQLTAANASHWPDTPFDQICTSTTTCPNRTSPSFFSRKRLTTINTETLAGSAWSSVDTWTLGQTYPATDVSPSLFLSSITHQGRVGGTLTNPSVTFTSVAMPNRVDKIGDGAPEMRKHRVVSITSESGQTTSVNYSAADCTPTSKPANVATNTRRCFPVYTSIEGATEPTLQFFHKYVVNSVVVDDRTTDAPDELTSYEYLGTPAWHFDDNELTLLKYRSWGDWRGYSKVNVTTGAGAKTQTQYLFFRGMHDDYLQRDGGAKKTAVVTDSQGGEIQDANRYNGYVREQISYNGAGGDEVSGTISTPWVTATGSSGGDTAMILRTKSSATRTRLSSGSYRTAGTVSTFDEVGLPTSVDDLGDLSSSSDDRCTRYSYNRNTDLWLLSSVSREEKVSVACGTTPNRPSQVISDQLSYYDGATSLTAPPVRGLITKADTMSGWNSGPVYEQRSRTTYDSLGRVTETYDGLNRLTSKVAFTPATGGPVTAKTTTDAKGYTNVTSISPAWGASLAEVDPNQRRTDLAYDAFGRLTGVWLPNRSKSGGATASVIFSYLVSQSAPNVVATQELKPDGTYKISRALFDGQLRQRQVQTPSANGVGRVMMDMRYDDRGNVASQDGPYYDSSSAPTNALFVPDLSQLPARTVNTYDGANRNTVAQYISERAEKWRTETIYGGNAIAVIPPEGDTTTIKMIDARGKVSELRQFKGRAAGGAYDSTKYDYTPDDQIDTVTNSLGSVWKYDYDVRGRQVRSDDPDRGVTTTAYDAADRVVSEKDGRGQQLFYTYDELDRKTEVRGGTATGPVLASWVYDTLGKGLLTSSTRTVNGNSYVSAITGYDSMDRPTGTQTVIPASEGKLAGTYSTTTTYNPDGTVKSAKLPSTPGLPDEKIDLYYDENGNLDSMLGWQAYVGGTVYGPFGDPLQYHVGQTTGQTAYQSFTYENGTRRLSKMRVDKEGVVQPQDTFDYTYDDASNVKSVSHTFGTSKDLQCFTTDYLRRTTEAWTPAGTCAAAKSASTLGGPAPYWQSYTFDASGNRTSLTDHKAAGDTTSTYAYPSPTATRPHAVTGVSTSGPGGTSADTYGYDGSGNMATRTVGGDTDTFTWDPEGHLSSVSGPAGDTDFVYDAEGSRLIRHDPKGATLYLASAEVRWDKTADTVTTSRYYDFNGTPIAMRNSSSSVEYMMADPQGTATVSFDGLTTAISRRFMDSYGNPRGTPSPTWEQNSHGFVNGVDDTSTGLTQLGAREYDSKLGRFISVDSILDVSDPITLNGYRYGNNSPASYSDPEGLRDMLETPDDFGHATPVKPGQAPTLKQMTTEQVEESTHKQKVAEVTHHREAKEEAKRIIRKVIKNLVKIVADELGITDALNCFTDGDIGACVSTGVTVLSSFAGGVAGKLLSKYLLHAKKAWKLVGRIKDLIGEAIDGIKGFRKAEDELHKAEEAVGATCSINSFKPGTLVRLADGSQKPIEDLQIGDEVLAADPATGRIAAEPVVRTIIGQGAKDLVELKLTATEADGKKSTSVVTATAGHPFYVPAEGRWLAASRLAVGNRLSSLGRPVVVTASRSYTTPAKVHNLTVDKFHTYYVMAGSTPVLVHNCGVGQAKGSACTCDADQLFSRFGTSVESTGRLTKRAAEAEQGGNGHGLSVTTADQAAEGISVASRADIEAAGFSLRYTPSRKDPMHHTLLLPKPVTSGVKNQFNSVFGRR